MGKSSPRDRQNNRSEDLSAELPGPSSPSLANNNQQLKGSASFKSVYEEEEDDDPLKCGVGSCTPDWLQKLHTAKWLLLILGICAFNQSFVINAIFPVDLSTLEKRFHMTSTQTGIISSWYDFAVLLAVFPICHWGNLGHKGRWIGFGSLIMGFGSLICSMPHFISAPWEIDNSLNTSDYGQCTNRLDMSEKCGNRPHSLLDNWYMNPFFLIFLLGQTFHGFGATPLFSLGTAYIDENVSQKSSPVYLAIHSLLTTIGPIFGFFAGGKLLTVYEDFDRIDVSKLPMKNSRDPRWVGAWWVGFLCCAIASLFISMPIMMFAKELPEAKKHRAKDVNQVHVNSQIDPSDELLKQKNFGQLSKAVWNILRNPTFVAVMAIGNFEAIILNGFSAFMPKILETILSTTPTIGSYLASVVIFAAAAGVMVGGIAIRQMKLQVGGMLKMILVCHLIALGLITCLLVQCPVREFVGITLGYDQQKPKTGLPSLHSACNADCHCTNKWSPVCDKSTGLTYFSACYAGCKYKENVPDVGTVWKNCGCLMGQHENTTTTTATFLPSIGLHQSEIVNGFCTKDCGLNLYLFLTLLFFSVVASFAAGIPNQQIMLRVIPFQERTLGIAVNWTFHRLLGFIPGGILFGFMIDTTCQKWQESDCGTKHSCLVHDQYRLAWTIMAQFILHSQSIYPPNWIERAGQDALNAIVCKLMAVLATIIGYVTYRPNDLDSAMSIQTTDSRGPLSLVVNDDRPQLRPAHANALSTDSAISNIQPQQSYQQRA